MSLTGTASSIRGSAGQQGTLPELARSHLAIDLVATCVRGVGMPSGGGRAGIKKRLEHAGDFGGGVCELLFSFRFLLLLVFKSCDVCIGFETRSLYF